MTNSDAALIDDRNRNSTEPDDTVTEHPAARRQRNNGDLLELEPIIASVNGAEDYYEKLFNWPTPRPEKRYLFQHVAPLASGHYAVYPFDHPNSKTAVVIEKNELYRHINDTEYTDSESTTPIISIITWSIFFFVIFYYIVPIKTAIYIGTIVFFIWITLKKHSERSEKRKFDRKYEQFEKFHDDKYKNLREKLGNIIYTGKTFNSFFVDLLIILSSFTCVLFIFYYSAQAKNIFFIATSTIGLMYLLESGISTVQTLLTLNRFRRNTGRFPAHQDMVHIAPDAPLSPYFR